MNLLALPLVLVPALASAQVPAGWVGSWYSETKEDKVYNGKSYDMRRELLVLRDDGTHTNTLRYYAGSDMVGEFSATFAWGVDNGVYWTVCRTLLLSSSAAPCSFRSEFDVVSANSREIRYRSRKSGNTYTMLRVRDDYKLP